jgi:hypothetical protein
MSILGSFFRSPAPPQDRGLTELAQHVAALAQRVEALESRIANIDLVTMLNYNANVARELRELLADPKYGAPGRLERHGRKVWSQNDEDGILEEIFRRIGTASGLPSGSFVEFGVSHGRECNTLKLLVEGWRGLWMEYDPAMCERIRLVFAAPLGEGRLELQQTAVSIDNINALLAASKNASTGELDLLSIDIDGNDYHVMQALTVRPRVLVVEYNGKYPPPMDLVPEYRPSHFWDGSDYAGSSLQALANLGERMGYRLVGTNLLGVNAFFVRQDLAGDKFAQGGAAVLFNPARYHLTPGYVAGHPPGGHFSYTSDAKLKSK